MLGFDALGRLALGAKPGVVVAATVYEDSWHQPLSERTRRRRPLPIATYQFASFVKASPFPETVTADKWFVTFSEPVRFRKRLNTANQQFASFVQFAPFYETVTADRWYVPFSEPVRFRKRLNTGNQQFAASLGLLPLTNFTVLYSVSFFGSADLSGVPTSNYKQVLSETKRRLIYTAEISPWTLSE